MKIFYYEAGFEPILLADIMTNRSMTIWHALSIAGVDMDSFAMEQGWTDGWDAEAVMTEEEVKIAMTEEELKL